jgi:exoribonuclease R
VGLLRQQRERDRGGVSLPVPEQVLRFEAGGWRLGFRAALPVEGWTAQVSVLTGMAAAELMLYGEVGVLRTLPEPPARSLDRLRHVALGLGVEWPAETSYAEVVRSRDPADPSDVAFLQEATSLLRGAGYTAFDGGIPELATHAAVAAEYAHVTAPLRRLVDRYAGQVCLALIADEKLSDPVRDALPGLPAAMAAADRRADQLERSTLDLVAALVLRPLAGEEMDAVVIDADAGGGGEVQLRSPAVRAHCEAREPLPLGQRVRVRLVEAVPAERRVRFVPV